MVDVVVFSPEKGDVLLIRRDKNLTRTLGLAEWIRLGGGCAGLRFVASYWCLRW
jgi:hypothetical protein